jgi:chromosome condensin MukBEF complex kleisin-like MukF subunit
MHSFTQEDLIQYMYDETSNEKRTAIGQALNTDWKLREEYEALSSAQKTLEKVSLSPREKALDFIINYAGKPAKEVLDIQD